MAEFNLQTLARYPFLPQAKDYVSSLNMTLDEIQRDPLYGGSFELGKKRVIDGILGRISLNLDDRIQQELSILSFAVARILSALTGNRTIIRRYAAGEAENAHHLLLSEEEPIIRRLMEAMDIKIKENKVPFQQYLKLTKDIAGNSPEWKLVNREMNSGMVKLRNSEPLILLREAIKLRIMEPPNLLGIPPWFKETAKWLNSTQQPRTEFRVDRVREDAIPPCISAMLSGLEAGNASHNSMFILGTFFIGLGLPVNEVVRIFSRFPRFDEEKTRYQLEFLAGGKSTTRYSCPTCAKIKSYGLCVRDCGVKHPLQYYRNRIMKGGNQAIEKKEDSGARI